MDVIAGLTVGVLMGGLVCLGTAFWLDLQRRKDERVARGHDASLSSKPRAARRHLRPLPSQGKQRIKDV